MRIPRSLIFEKIPLLALAGISCLTTLFAQKAALRTSTDFPFLVRLGNAAQSYVAYIRQMFWPSDLAAYYPFAIQDVTLTKVCSHWSCLPGFLQSFFSSVAIATWSAAGFGISSCSSR